MSEGTASLPNVGAAVTAGEILRAAREKQGLHLAALAASMKVSPRKLEALEANRYEELPDATFARALALSMCRALKTDPEPVLARLPQGGDRGLEHVAQGLGQPFRGYDERRDAGDWLNFLSPPVIGAALLVLAAIVVYVMPAGTWSLGGRGEAEPPASPASSVGEAAPASAPPMAAPPVAAAPAPATVPQEPAAASAPVAGSTAAAPPVAGASAVVETVFSAPAESAQQAVTSLLVVRAGAESWVEVRDRHGAVLLSRTLAAGESAGIDGAVPLRLTIGNAEQTQVLFRGQPVTLSAMRDNVARLELK